MCGRFNVESDPLSRLLLSLVNLAHPGPDNHNAAPTETIMVLRLNDVGEAELAPMRWWLTPHWARDSATRYAMFNARAETAATSPAFREPFAHRRCLVPVCGFYEWARQGGRKLPYYLRPHDQPGMLLAGIWDRWRNRETQETLESFAILTSEATPAMSFLHRRQPVMLAPAEALRWLDAGLAQDDAQRLVGPRLPMDLDAVPLSSRVNDARHKDRRCLEAAGAVVAVPAAAPAGAGTR